MKESRTQILFSCCEFHMRSSSNGMAASDFPNQSVGLQVAVIRSNGMAASDFPNQSVGLQVAVIRSNGMAASDFPNQSVGLQTTVIRSGLTGWTGPHHGRLPCNLTWVRGPPVSTSQCGGVVLCIMSQCPGVNNTQW